MVVEPCFFCFGCIDIALAKLGRTSAFNLTLPYLTHGHIDLTGGFFRLFLQARLYSLHLLGDVEDRDDDGGGVLTATELR